MNKRVVIWSDMHCGHRAGLTPPGWQYQAESSDAELAKFAKHQALTWDFVTRKIDELKPIDILIVNGDLVEGKGEKSGATELIVADRQKQAEMAAECIKYVGAKNTIITYGTPYHGGVTEDFENDVAKEVKADKIGGHEWLDVNGVVFDCKHRIASSSIPHGRHTAPARDVLWNFLWALEEEGQPKSDIFIRSHVHYFTYAGTNRYFVVTTPALLGWGCKYGTRICSGIINYGFLHFDVAGKGDWTWKAHILNAKPGGELLLKL
ncbi:MAG: hypothetical protein V2B18_00785 [Pseudomonadota bacterium]